MENITEIMNMLDWHMPAEVQSRGRKLAKDIKEIQQFLQPLTPQYNKNVWENCAIILSEKCDEELRPYLVELLGWLQDMNWPGAFCILDRTQKYKDNNSLCAALRICKEKAKCSGDEIWESNLNMIEPIPTTPPEIS